MKVSQLFPKTKREAPKDAVAVNHKLLVRAGFIDQLMAGSWTLLPLGWRVVSKINDIIREELNKTGAQEILMPLMHPKEIWNETGRWDSARQVMYQFKDSREKEFALSFTHEEIILDLVRKYLKSYADLPIKLYHFSTKFRNEARPTGGILRGREFLMKDLYSLHASEGDFNRYYNEVKEAYLRVFSQVELDAYYTEAAGGVFTTNKTNEFQVLSETGEDTIYICKNCKRATNKEVFSGKVGDKCSSCGKGSLEESRAIEVGNIFPFGTYYSEKMGVYFTDKDGSRKPVWFGSYGIGTTRLLGAIVEVFHDEAGIIWPEAVAPYKYHLIEVKSQKSKVKSYAEEICNKLVAAGEEVLFDDREDISAGEKFADADLIGCPYRLVVSDKTGEKIEVKKRVSREPLGLLSTQELLSSKGGERNVG